LQDQEAYGVEREETVSAKVMRELAAAQAAAASANAEVATLRERTATLEATLLAARTEGPSPAKISGMKGNDSVKLVSDNE
jgi:hypothetical protein